MTEMKLKTIVLKQNKDVTISQLILDGVKECFVLQDGDKRIPEGTYVIKLRKEGGMHIKYEQKFGKKFHKGMLELQNVPGFKYILIHIGNTMYDTKGCLLTGTSFSEKSNFVSESAKAYMDLYPKVAQDIIEGKEVWISIDYTYPSK